MEPKVSAQPPGGGSAGGTGRPGQSCAPPSPRGDPRPPPVAPSVSGSHAEAAGSRARQVRSWAGSAAASYFVVGVPAGPGTARRVPAPSLSEPWAAAAGTPGPAEARRAEGRRLRAGGSGAPGPQQAALGGGTGAAGARRRRRQPGAPPGSPRCVPDPWGEVWSPSGAFLNHLVRRRRLAGCGGGCGQGRAPGGRRLRGWAPRRPCSPGCSGCAAGRRRARPGVQDSGARHSQVPSRPSFGRRTFFLGEGVLLVTRYPPLGPNTKLRARGLAARQPWKCDKSGTVCRRKFLMQLSAFADCLSKRLPDDCPGACALWKLGYPLLFIVCIFSRDWK